MIQQTSLVDCLVLSLHLSLRQNPTLRMKCRWSRPHPELSPTALSHQCFGLTPHSLFYKSLLWHSSVQILKIVFAQKLFQWTLAEIGGKAETLAIYRAIKCGLIGLPLRRLRERAVLLREI
jgi:hypothetical protein